MSQNFATSLLGVCSEGRALYREVEVIKLGRENMGRGNSSRVSTKVHRVRYFGVKDYYSHR